MGGGTLKKKKTDQSEAVTNQDYFPSFLHISNESVGWLVYLWAMDGIRMDRRLSLKCQSRFSHG